MIYAFDTNSFRVLENYFPKRFPSFWERFNNFVSDGNVISVKEVFRELDIQATKQHFREWMSDNRKIFLAPSPEETEFVKEIFSNPHFQALLKLNRILTGGPVADPFVIASAKARGCCVVTEETRKDNAAKIPNVCEHFGIDCTNLEGLMERERWEF